MPLSTKRKTIIVTTSIFLGIAVLFYLFLLCFEKQALNLFFYECKRIGMYD